MTRLYSISSLLRLIGVSLAVALSMACDNGLQAKKTPTALCGRVYLYSGDHLGTEGDEVRIGAPVKNKKLEIIDNAYTKKSKINTRLEPASVDSVVMWAPTAPNRPHTFRHIKGYGWCWQLESNPHLAVYCFSPKGYFFAGNGGLWTRGKGTLLVVKDGKTYNFGRPDKKVNDNIRRRLAALVSDDANLSSYFNEATGRRDKIVRNLSRYNP